MSRPFIEEIDYREITLLGVVGKGSFGTVRKGKWKDLEVAVKMIETEQEKKAFIVEVQQLSRVNHPNIVKLYGACTTAPVCLVMEYAEGGSLYNVLHCMKHVEYTAAHAISWLLQCAKGVAYLHSMKPTALIHRDLKPPNLLLVMGGTVIKICDFGTACDKHTIMTNTKGSAAWMAPEVFEGSQYNEKCDIFSWAIILWEVLTRKKPFYDVGGTAFCIMWAIHNNVRPPLITGCPKPLERLMTRCWDKDPLSRPSMLEVVEKLEEIFKFVKGSDEPITFAADEDTATSSPEELDIGSSISPNPTRSSDSKTVLPIIDRLDQAENSMFLLPCSERKSLLSSEKSSNLSHRDDMKRHSADVSSVELKLPLGHRRSESYDSALVNIPFEQDTKESKNDSELSDGKIHSPRANRKEGGGVQFENAYLMLELELQPLQPATDCRESLQIFRYHCQAAREFLQLKDEVSLLTEKRNKLQKQLQDCHNLSTYADEYLQLKKEKENLLLLRKNLKLQLEMIKARRQTRQTNKNDNNQSSEEWVIV